MIVLNLEISRKHTRILYYLCKSEFVTLTLCSHIYIPKGTFLFGSYCESVAVILSTVLLTCCHTLVARRSVKTVSTCEYIYLLSMSEYINTYTYQYTVNSTSLTSFTL